jgi:demethylmenaquinone methyltransferase/2-methoxy-6-polyprenyl-1,4-benzoquinol methylase
MYFKKSTYKWLYDHKHSKYYNLLMKFCYLPFDGEKKCRERLLKGVEFGTNEKILDMCCGTGGTTFLIADKTDDGCEIIGIDLSSGQLRKAKKKNTYSNVLLKEGNVTNTKFIEGFFDKICISFALHEMKRDERLDVLKEAKRVLKDCGKLIIFEIDEPESNLRKLFIYFWFFYWLPLNPETPTRKDLQKHKLTNEIKEAGFNIISKTNYYKETFQTVVAQKKLK